MELLGKDTSNYFNNKEVIKWLLLKDHSLQKKKKKRKILNLIFCQLSRSFSALLNLLKTNSVHPWELNGWKVKLSRHDMLIDYSRNKKKKNKNQAIVGLLMLICIWNYLHLLLRKSLDIFPGVCEVLSENFRLLKWMFSSLLLLATMIVIHASFSFFHE